jgi:preprotein translocase subunit SecE
MAKLLNKIWLVRYIRESYIELRKVVWPSQETVRKHTILVIAISIFIAVYFMILDALFARGLEALI